MEPGGEHQLHFGAGMALGAAETASQARWMEDLGYEYFAAGEHYMRGNPPGPTHAAGRGDTVNQQGPKGIDSLVPSVNMQVPQPGYQELPCRIDGSSTGRNRDIGRVADRGNAAPRHYNGLVSFRSGTCCVDYRGMDERESARCW